MLKHHQAIGHTNAQGAARSTFTNHGGNHRHLKGKHLAQVHGNGFALAQLFGLQAGVGTGGVDETDHRQAKT